MKFIIYCVRRKRWVRVYGNNDRGNRVKDLGPSYRSVGYFLKHNRCMYLINNRRKHDIFHETVCSKI